MNEFAWLADLGVTTLLAITVVVMAVVLFQVFKRVKSNGCNDNKNLLSVQPQDQHFTDRRAHERIDEFRGDCAKTHIELSQRVAKVETNVENIGKNVENIDKKVDNISVDIGVIKKSL